MTKSRVSTLVRAQRLASRSLTVMFGMLAPGFAGAWVDGLLGSDPWLMLAGFAVGFAYGVWRLATLASAASGNLSDGRPAFTPPKTGRPPADPPRPPGTDAP